MDLEAKKRQLLENGFCVVPGVLARDEADRIRERLWQAAEESERRGVPTRQIGLDPNEHNVRVFYLLERDAIFRELIQHPTAIEFVTTLLTSDFLISNFTANIALPGSKSMELHSDQGIVVPEPWLQPWSVNIIWCLNDVDEENGATRYIPGSHKIQSASELPENAAEKTVPFEAPAGSIVVMDGRVWHTSGANVSQSRERALLFGYYSRSFVRQQQNWNASLSPETLESLSPQLRSWLGLEPRANVTLGARLRIHPAHGRRPTT
ncbi:MAG: phytanoyl-CoA dioxygenase family protein [Alphaproteobacteria bacterium]|nr:phytanoyl-CoA dioxygenase family protein [Alphaproteobacteria bacterium]